MGLSAVRCQKAPDASICILLLAPCRKPHPAEKIEYQAGEDQDFTLCENDYRKKGWKRGGEGGTPNSTNFQKNPIFSPPLIRIPRCSKRPVD